MWGRRAHLPLVSAAIAGHMTEAVAGMTVRALATRGGGGGGETLRRWKGMPGCRPRERKGEHPSPWWVIITVSFDPLLPGSPCLCPKTKMEAQFQSLEGGVASCSRG